MIACNAHEMINLTIDGEVCYTDEREEAVKQNKVGGFLRMEIKIRHLIQKVRCRIKSKREVRRRWPIMLYPILTEKRIASMRC